MPHPEKGPPINVASVCLSPTPSRRCSTDAPGQPVRAKASVHAHDLIQDSLSFRSDHKNQPPVLLLPHFFLSRCHVHFRLLLRHHPCMHEPAVVQGVQEIRPAWMALDGLLGFAPAASPPV